MASRESIADDLALAASSAGADSFDILVVDSRSTSVGVRAGELENLESNASQDVGLRVFLGKRQAVVSGSDVSGPALQALATRAVAMAELAPEDPFCGLAEDSQLASNIPDLHLSDGQSPDPGHLRERARQLDAAARAVPGVAQAEGASAGVTESGFHLLASNGFRGAWTSTRHTLGVSAYAERDGAMERDYDYQGRRHLEDLPSAEEVGTTAGERAVRRLGASQMESGTLPVIFDRRVASRILGAFLSATSGPAVARGTSYLGERMGERIFPEGFTISDDPRRPRGLGSRPFDAEGLPGEAMNIVEDGVLRHWLLNLGSARKLGLTSTARASRGVGSPPGVSATNAHIHPGAIGRDDLLRDTGDALLVAEMFGPSLNPNTGDYSVGVAGFAVEGGEVTRPVSEVTVAGNLLDMFRAITAANDLQWDGATVSPTLRIEAMTLAGS